LSEDKTGNEHPGNGPSDPPESADSAADISPKAAQETRQESSGDQAATAEPQSSASTPAETPPPAAAPAAPVAPVAAPPRGSSGAIAWLALLLALAVAAGGVWSITEAQRREAELLQRVQALESSGGQDTSTFDQMRDNLERKIELELEGLVARQQRAAEDQERALTRMEGLASDAAGAVRRDIAGDGRAAAAHQ
jgi:uroporphyrin-3 C-methyltransferase